MKNENPSDGTKDRQQTIDVVRQNWRAEVETARVYRDLAADEKDEKRRGIYCAWRKQKSATHSAGRKS
jgi:hypothetical protein